MAAISGRFPAVAIEYDCRGLRKAKQFDSAQQAKRFYAKKLHAGRRPAVVKHGQSVKHGQ